MKWALFLVALILGVGAAQLHIIYADPMLALVSQPRTDQFQYQGQSLDIYNPLSRKVRNEGIVNWDYRVEPGCSGGGILGQTIGQAMGNIYDETGTIFVYQDPDRPIDLTIRDNCGVAFTAICGTGAAACLGRQYPYVLDIDFSQDVASYYELSRVSVVLHELMGHALATWNEQYGSNLQPSPGWEDFMNTGVLSRHLVQDIERNRWGRTMGAPAPQRYGYDRAGGYLWFCGLDARASGVFVWGLGSYNLGSDIKPTTEGCYGIGIEGWLEDPVICFDVGNAVDWKRAEYRSDRCVER